MGRGGRIILDRLSSNADDFWRTLDFTIYEPNLTIPQCKSVGDVKSNVNSNKNLYTNLDVNSHLNNHIDFLKTNVKSELNYNDNSVRTSVNSVDNGSFVNISHVIKQEPEEVNEEWSSSTAAYNVGSRDSQKDDTLKFLEEIRKDWYVYHFLIYSSRIFILYLSSSKIKKLINYPNPICTCKMLIIDCSPKLGSHVAQFLFIRSKNFMFFFPQQICTFSGKCCLLCMVEGAFHDNISLNILLYCKIKFSLKSIFIH